MRGKLWAAVAQVGRNELSMQHDAHATTLISCKHVRDLLLTAPDGAFQALLSRFPFLSL